MAIKIFDAVCFKYNNNIDNYNKIKNTIIIIKNNNVNFGCI